MQTPLQIVFHEVAHSPMLEDLVRKKTRKLETVFPRLIRCHVSLGQSQLRKRQARPFTVRVTLHLPGGELVVDSGQHEDVYAAVHEAFNVLRQQLETHARRTRREIRSDAGTRLAAVGSQSAKQG